MTRLSGTFVLAPDTSLLPATGFGAAFLRDSGAEAGEFVLSRRDHRAPSKVVDSATAGLLGQFAKPSTIAMAVARFSRATDGDPELVLEESLPLLRCLVADGLLVDSDAVSPPRRAAPIRAGDVVAGWLVVRTIQSLNDTEVHKVRSRGGLWGALKIDREANERGTPGLRREAALLSGASGSTSARLLDSGEFGGRCYLVTEWVSGIDVQTAADEIGSAGRLEARPGLLKLGSAILTAYEALHEQGLLHGDIHPENLLVDRHGAVKLIDLGLAVFLDGRNSPGRGGIAFFLEPEYARAFLNGEAPPPASLAGEQYALAALLYLLLTGSHTQDFALERPKMLHQIANGAVQSFTGRGLSPWPAVEEVLGRALNKDPAARFSSTRAFAAAWKSIEVETVLPEASSDKEAGSILPTVLRDAAIDGEWMRAGFELPPRATINSGYAGLAYALYRIAASTYDGELLAAADVWSARALQAMDDEGAFDGGSGAAWLKMEPLSLHHQRPGVYATEALIAAARGDELVLLEAAGRFVSWNRRALAGPVSNLDLTLGLAGGLLGAVLLLDSLRAAEMVDEVETSELRHLGAELYERIWTQVEQLSTIGDAGRLQDLGMAHGWAGILYACLCWRSAAREALPEPLIGRLRELAALAEPFGRGLCWPSPGAPVIPGWCNGSAGLVFLWTEAYRATQCSDYLGLAEGAAWSTWESPSSYPTLCCGLAGQAYALLNMHRHSGERCWLDRAKQMAARAAGLTMFSSQQGGAEAPEVRPESLYHGLAGLAVLEADLADPLTARMPFLERE